MTDYGIRNTETGLWFRDIENDNGKIKYAWTDWNPHRWFSDRRTTIGMTQSLKRAGFKVKIEATSS